MWSILEEPEGFHLRKENHKPKQAADHKFSNITCETESSEDEFQGLPCHPLKVEE